MALVLVPSGEFVMGSPDGPENWRPPHRVQISRPFYLGACEVTQEQYETIMEKNPSYFSGRPKNPVDDVTWIDAVTFCNRLSRREKLPEYYRIADVERRHNSRWKGLPAPHRGGVGICLPGRKSR